MQRFLDMIERTCCGTVLPPRGLGPHCRPLWRILSVPRLPHCVYQPKVNCLGALSIFCRYLVQTLSVRYDLRMKRFWTAPSDREGGECAAGARKEAQEDELNLSCISCTGDEGRSFEVGFQEQASNHSKLLRSKAVGGEHWSQSTGLYPGQVWVRETNVSEPLLKRRKLEKNARQNQGLLLPLG